MYVCERERDRETEREGVLLHMYKLATRRQSPRSPLSSPPPRPALLHMEIRYHIQSIKTILGTIYAIETLNMML